MKALKKAFTLVLVLAMVMSLGMTAFAASDYSITVHNTIADTNVSISGQTFKAYKIFDVDYEGKPGTDDTANAAKPHSYTIAAEFAGTSNPSGGWTVDPLVFNGKSGDAILSEISSETADSSTLFAFAEAVKDYIDLHDQNGSGAKKDVAFSPVSGSTCTTVPSAPTEDDPVTEENITIPVTEPGYYMVFAQGTAQNADGAATAGEKLVTAALAMDTTNANAVIEFKGQAPVLTKLADGQKAAADAYIGKDITFTLNTKVPAMTGFTTYKMVFHDNLSKGLTLKTSGVSGAVTGADVKVAIGGVDLIIDQDYTVEKTAGAADGETALTITISDLKALDADETGHSAVAKDADIVVTYAATVNGYAQLTQHDTNAAYMEYSNHPYDENSVAKTVKDEVKVFNFDLDVDKYTTETSGEVRLAGAEFMLYRLDASSQREYYKWLSPANVISWVPAADAAAAQADGVKAAVRKTVLSEGNTVSSLDTLFKGLSAGTYYLEETKAPTGYNKLKEAVKIEIKPVYNTTTHALERVQYIVNGTPLPAGSAGDQPGIAIGTGRVSFAASVENVKGAELPTTGGIGTTIFYAAGAILMVTALVLLITKKKMSSK